MSKAFELMASGSYTKHDVLRMVNALGLTTRKGAPVSKQSFHQMMTNPTYKGWVVSRRRARGNYGERQVPHVLQNEDFPLRGFVRCASIHAKDLQRQHDRFEYGPVTWGLETVRVGIHFLDPLECPWIESVNTKLHPLSIGEEEA